MADTAWFVIREQNLRFDWIKDVKTKRPFYFRVLTWYMDRVMELVHDDLDAYREFLAVVHLVKPPSALMKPRVRRASARQVGADQAVRTEDTDRPQLREPHRAVRRPSESKPRKSPSARWRRARTP